MKLKVLCKQLEDFNFKIGDKVKTRGDIGSLNFIIIAIHNEYYCTLKGYGKKRHFNMAYLTKAERNIK